MTFTLGEQQKILMGTLKENGASLVGFGDVSVVKLELTENFPVAISLAVKYSEKVVENLHINEEAFHKHDIELEAFMKQLINIVGNLLSKWDYEYTITPTSILIKDDRQLRELQVFPSKTAATCAGLGWIGKNALLVTPQYGPRIKLGTI